MALFLRNASDQSSWRRSYTVEHSKYAVLDEDSGLVTLRELTTTLYKNGQKLYQLMKVAWPPLAVPGDEGYGGAGVSINRSLLTEREKIIYDNGLKNFGVNLLASERISFRRNITLNMLECQNITYDRTNLPKAGIVIIFTEEMWSSLMRTVFSVLDAGPEELISEIILVDDASQKEHLGKPLEDYIKIFAGKVKLVRLPERKGLIVARNVGSQHVTGEIVVFLDGHCEVHKGWLEPLLHRIKEDDSVIAIPQTDILEWDTFKFHFDNNSNHHMCGFEFDRRYSWIPIPQPDGITRKTWSDPIGTPTHMGCCLAASKTHFERLGGYDPGLEIWGCENLELSFKTWMCWGRLEVIPCSHIAHMYRPKFPYKWVGKPYIYERNCLRVAEVWMDQYKVFYQHRLSNLQNTVDIGDVSERKAIREKLKCRSFDWYVKEIFPDIYLPINTTAIGRISNLAHPALCIEKDLDEKDKQPECYQCRPQNEKQYFYLTREKQIRRDSKCLSYKIQKKLFVSETCSYDRSKWSYSQDNLIIFGESNLCMTLSSNKSTIFMATCNSSDTTQQWSWSRESIILS
ncbi:hypothetical protein BsWGS_16667 [Bradybaena similaris]